MTVEESVELIRQQAARSGCSVYEFARRMNEATPEQIAQAMELCDTETLEWAVRFEALGEGGKRW